MAICQFVVLCATQQRLLSQDTSEMLKPYCIDPNGTGNNMLRNKLNKSGETCSFPLFPDMCKKNSNPLAEWYSNCLAGTYWVMTSGFGVSPFWNSSTSEDLYATSMLPLLYPPEASGGYFGLAFAMLPPRIERLLALTLSEENYTSWVYQICRISSLGGKLLWKWN